MALYIASYRLQMTWLLYQRLDIVKEQINELRTSR